MSYIFSRNFIKIICISANSMIIVKFYIPTNFINQIFIFFYLELFTKLSQLDKHHFYKHRQSFIIYHYSMQANQMILYKDH